MRSTYDPQADALSIDLVVDGVRARTVKVEAGILAHLDAQNRLIELEIIGASAFYSVDELKGFESPAEYLTLARAAKESGLSHNTLRLLVNQGKLRATKRGRDWVVTTADLWNYLDNRDARGARPQSRKARRARKEQTTKKVAAS